MAVHGDVDGGLVHTIVVAGVGLGTEGEGDAHAAGRGGNGERALEQRDGVELAAGAAEIGQPAGTGGRESHGEGLRGRAHAHEGR